jgi:hypothetical protein
VSAYDPRMAPKAIIVLDADGIDDAVLAAAGLRAGQTVVAEATDAGLLLRAPTEAELATADRLTAAEVKSVLRRYPATIDRLGR